MTTDTPAMPTLEEIRRVLEPFARICGGIDRIRELDRDAIVSGWINVAGSGGSGCAGALSESDFRTARDLLARLPEQGDYRIIKFTRVESPPFVFDDGAAPQPASGETCRTCGGYRFKITSVPCPDCTGSAPASGETAALPEISRERVADDVAAFRAVALRQTCPTCKGKGWLNGGIDNCSDCNGTGRIPAPAGDAWQSISTAPKGSRGDDGPLILARWEDDFTGPVYWRWDYGWTAKEGRSLGTPLAWKPLLLCPECRGNGVKVVSRGRFSDDSENNEEQQCAECKGWGRVIPAPTGDAAQSLDGSLTVEEAVAGVLDLFPGSDKQALQGLAELLCKPPAGDAAPAPPLKLLPTTEAVERAWHLWMAKEPDYDADLVSFEAGYRAALASGVQSSPVIVGTNYTEIPQHYYHCPLNPANGGKGECVCGPNKLPPARLAPAPDEAVERIARAIYNADRDGSHTEYDNLGPYGKEVERRKARAALAASGVQSQPRERLMHLMAPEGPFVCSECGVQQYECWTESVEEWAHAPHTCAGRPRAANPDRAAIVERERCAAFAEAKHDWPPKWIAASLRGENDGYSNFCAALAQQEPKL